MPCSTVHAASASYPSPFPVIVPEFLSHVQVPWFCVSLVLCSFFFFNALPLVFWSWCKFADDPCSFNRLLVPRLHPPSTSSIHRRRIPVIVATHIPRCVNLISSPSLLDRILLFQSLFVFSENIQRDKGVCFLWTYGDCSRRFALVSGPATGLIVGPGPHF